MATDNNGELPRALEERGQSADQRLHAPSAARNKDPVLQVLLELLPSAGQVLEVGAGTGEHCVHFAAALPGLHWRPSDPDAASRASAAAWIAHAGLRNVAPPIHLDVCDAVWGVEGVGPFDAIISLNMIHIAPWRAALGLFAGAGSALRGSGLLFLYGPFKRNGVHTAPSNAAFDDTLKARNPDWGVRDIADLEALGAQHALMLGEVIAMPANNLSLAFYKR